MLSAIISPSLVGELLPLGPGGSRGGSDGMGALSMILAILCFMGGGMEGGDGDDRCVSNLWFISAICYFFMNHDGVILL